MAVAASDIKFFLAANHAEADTGTQGGAQSTTGRLLDDQFSGAARPEFDSDNAGDTQNVTVTGRLATGAVASETKAMNGTTAVLFDTTFERILKVEHASPCTGIVTMAEGTGGTVRHTFAAGEDEARNLFYGAFAEASGGSPKVRYEKVFVENTHATDSALSLTCEVTTDPSTRYDIVLEDAVDDNESVANRLTAPTGIDGAFADGPKTCVNTDLDADEAQGLWLKQTLAAGATPTLDIPVITVAFTTA
jgi:hypothetical protein